MYIVKKPLSIGGVRRTVGSVVTAEEAPNAALLERTGYLAKTQEALTGVLESTGFVIPLAGKDEPEEISLSDSEVQEVFAVLQMSAEEAVAIIADIESEAEIKLLCACDNRKSIVNATKARMKELSDKVVIGG